MRIVDTIDLVSSLDVQPSSLHLHSQAIRREFRLNLVIHNVYVARSTHVQQGHCNLAICTDSVMSV